MKEFCRIATSTKVVEARQADLGVARPAVGLGGGRKVIGRGAERGCQDEEVDYYEAGGGLLDCYFRFQLVREKGVEVQVIRAVEVYPAEADHSRLVVHQLSSRVRTCEGFHNIIIKLLIC